MIARHHQHALLLVGNAVHNGSYYGALASQFMEFGTHVSEYSAYRKRYTPSTDPSDPVVSNVDYAISIKHQGYWYEADAHMFDSCMTRFIDEASTEAEENCRFEVIEGVIWVITTRDVEQFEHMQGRYGHEYWCKLKWPLHLLLMMFTKYSPTLSVEEKLRWTELIKTKRAQQVISDC